MSETNMKPCIVFWQTVLYQNFALLLVSLHPLLTSIYCEIEIRAHKPRLPALIAMKECYQFSQNGVHCTCFLSIRKCCIGYMCVVLYTEWKLCNFMAIKSFHCHCQIRRFLEPCDLEIWRMTFKNNRAPLLCYFKLCAAFRAQWWIQTGVTVRKRPIWVKFDDF